jgi:hypothetical protein
VEDEISGLNDKTDIFKRPRSILRQKTEERKNNMQELCDSIKRQNLRIMGIYKEKRYKPKA